VAYSKRAGCNLPLILNSARFFCLTGIKKYVHILNAFDLIIACSLFLPLDGEVR